MSEQLDNVLINPDKVDFDISLGNVFPLMFNLLGFLFMLLGLAAIYAGITELIIGLFAGPVFIAGGAYVALTKTGVQIDRHKKQVRQYIKPFGVYKKGEWEDFSLYPFVAVLMSRQTSSVYSRGSSSYDITEVVWEVYLLNQTHRKKIQIDTADKKEAAEKKAKLWAQKLGAEFTVFNPVQISQRRKRN